MAHIPRGSELSLMISSLHAGGHRKSLGWELGSWVLSVALEWALVTLSRLLSFA